MTTSSTYQILLLAVFSCSMLGPCRAQPSRQVAITAVFGSPLPSDGLHRIRVRWYDDALASAHLWEETVDCELTAGRGELLLGRTVPITDTMLRGGRAFVGLTVEGESERRPRTEIVPQATALHASYADVAARLDPNATGLVTSLNELSGPVSLTGSNGITVQRSGTTLTISTARAQSERGSIQGDGRSATYRVRPQAILTAETRVLCRFISPTTTITGQTEIDLKVNELVFTTSAPMLPDERIEWTITP